VTDNKQVRNTFSKSERLYLKSRIDRLFKQGTSKRAGCLRMIYFEPDESMESPVQVMFSVPKKQFHRAIQRNLIRRRMSEAFRMNKHDLYASCVKEKKNLLLAFLYSGTSIEIFQVIERHMKQLLSKIPTS